MDIGLYLDDDDDSIVIADAADDPTALIRISFEGLFSALSPDIKMELASSMHRNLASIFASIVATQEVHDGD